MNSPKAFLESDYVKEREKEGIHPVITAVEFVNEISKDIDIGDYFDGLFEKFRFTNI